MGLNTVAVVLNTVVEVFSILAVVLNTVVRFPKTLWFLQKTEIFLIFMAFGLQMFSVHKVISLFRRSGCILKNPH